jgi:hypothetical protein
METTVNTNNEAMADARGALCFFEEAYQKFQTAEQAFSRPPDRYYILAGHLIRLRFASSALVPIITPALEHLATKEGGAPALTVCLWDTASTGVKMPPPPWTTGHYLARGEVEGFNDDRIHTSFDMGSGVLNMLDMQRNIGIFWTPDACDLPQWETGAPLRVILHWWMRRRDSQLTHAAAIGTSRGGVLLVGKGGSGKSTTALACLNSELHYVSDDYCLVQTKPEPYVYCVYTTGKIVPDSFEKFPCLEKLFSNIVHSNGEKLLFLLDKKYHARIAEGFPIRAIAMPCVTNNVETKFRRASPAQALASLAPSSIFQLPGAGQAEFRSLAGLIKQVPSYFLELGSDLTRIPDTIFRLLSEVD